MPHNAFVDSCVFIAYATEFEDHHPICVTFFEETKCDKYTSESVSRELSLKLKKRDDLYRDYSKFLAQGGTEYRASIYLNDNDQRHLEQLVRQLSIVPAHEKLTFLRLFNKRLKLRIEKAMEFIIEVIPRNNNAYFKAIINSVIFNEPDCWILNDAIQWSLSKSEVVFVTLDGEIYAKREMLLNKVIDYKSLDTAPIKIIHIGFNAV